MIIQEAWGPAPAPYKDSIRRLWRELRCPAHKPVTVVTARHGQVEVSTACSNCGKIVDPLIRFSPDFIHRHLSESLRIAPGKCVLVGVF